MDLKSACYFLDPHQGYKITLMGMSGVGKTTLTRLLPAQDWFHYSVDYRIGTRYLNEEIDDLLKLTAMQNPFLASLLRSDSMAISSKLSFNNLSPLSAYLGMLGDAHCGGLSVQEFERRLALHREAEIRATQDVSRFIHKAQHIYQYPHFICDTSGSLCEIEDEATWAALAEQTLIVYIKAPEDMQAHLMARAQTHPKPLYYQPAFLRQAVTAFLKTYQLAAVEEIVPTDFVRWVFPQLIAHRLPLYEHIATRYGVTICAEDALGVRDQDDFIRLIQHAADQQA